MTRTSRTVVFLALVAAAPLGVLATSRTARADEPSAVDAENALQLFKDGKALRERGDLAGSLEKLRAAHALVETPITALELGRAHALMGKLIEAREVWLAVARMPMRKNESVRANEARVECEKLASEARPKLASLVLKVPSVEGEPKVRVDGALLPPAALVVPRLVNPGAHVVTLETAGGTTRAEVNVVEGASETVLLEAPAAPAAVPPAQAPPPAVAPAAPPAPVVPPPAPSGNDGPRRAVLYGGLGAAGVGVVVGTLTGVMTLAQASSLKETCTADGRCPRAVEGDLSAASTLGAVSTVGFGLAIVGGLVAAGAYFLWKPTPRGSATLVPVPGGLVGTF